MTFFRDYRDLEVWQAGVGITRRIYELTEAMPPTERYGLTSQIRRAAVSIPANIAEGWGRRYRKDFIQFLRQANGSRTELETHLFIAAELGLLAKEEVDPILQDLWLLGRQLVSLERSLRKKS